MNKAETRPLLTEVDAADFREYYYRKDELAAFCRENGLSATGSKAELCERVGHYLATGKMLSPITKRNTLKAAEQCIELSAIIEPDFRCTQYHRAFFRQHIGKSFSFKVEFQQWLKENPGRTYQEAIEAYHRLQRERKTSSVEIGPQFEYNRYIRAFFADNSGGTLQDAIRCWNYKKEQKGSHIYERADLAALKDDK